MRDARASQVMTSGAIPQATWGSAAFGVPPSRIRQLRSMLVEGTGATAGGKRYTAAVALGYGEGADPTISMRVEQLWEWASMWYKLKPSS